VCFSSAFLGVPRRPTLIRNLVAEGLGSNDEERARRVLLDLESTWDRADYGGAATLWSENGQLADSIRTVRGRCAIEQELRAAQSEFGSPIKLADLTLTMVRPDTAVAAGRIRSAVREEGFSAILIEKKRDWKLESWIRYS
jgi:hypothetical protein